MCRAAWRTLCVQRVTLRYPADQEHPKLRDLFRLPDEEDRPHDLSLSLGDPAALARGIEIPDESRRDLGHERFEGLIPAVLLRVERAVTMDHPTHVARLVRPQNVRSLRLPAFAEKSLDRPHRSEQALLLVPGQLREHRRDLLYQVIWPGPGVGRRLTLKVH